MELMLNKQGVDCFEEIVRETIRKEETLDSVVPDTMPDIAEIISTSGLVLIRSKDVADGKIRLEANVAAKIVYTPEGGGAAQCLNVTVPVSLALDNDKIDSYCKCCAKIMLLSADTRALNPRKVLVRTEVTAIISCYKPGRVELCAAPEGGIEHVNLLEKEEYITPAMCVSEKSFVITDEHQIPASKAPVAEVLGTRVCLVVEETKSVGSKIVIKGSAKTQILYNPENGAMCCVEFITGFSQIVETDMVIEDPYTDLSLVLSGAYVDIKPESGCRVLSMELHVLAQFVVSEKRVLKCLTDAYSNTHNIDVSASTLSSKVVEREIAVSDTIHETVETPVQAVELIDFFTGFGVTSVSGNEITVPVTMNLIYTGADGAIHSHRKRIEAKTTMEIDGGEELGVLCVNCGNVYATVVSGAVEMRISLDIRAAAYMQKTIDYICDVTVSAEANESNSDRPSIVLKMVSNTDDLWEIAKEYGSTIEAITEANELNFEDIWEKYILIPRS